VVEGGRSESVCGDVAVRAAVTSTMAVAGPDEDLQCSTQSGAIRNFPEHVVHGVEAPMDPGNIANTHRNCLKELGVVHQFNVALLDFEAEFNKSVQLIVA